MGKEGLVCAYVSCKRGMFQSMESLEGGSTQSSSENCWEETIKENHNKASFWKGCVLLGDKYFQMAQSQAWTALGVRLLALYASGIILYHTGPITYAMYVLVFEKTEAHLFAIDSFSLNFLIKLLLDILHHVLFG